MTWAAPPLAGRDRRTARGRRAVAVTAAFVVAQIAAASAVALSAAGCDEASAPVGPVPSSAAVSPASSSGSPATTVRVTVRDIVLDVEVADTPDRQVRGLSGRDSLAPRSGMLFSFGVPTSGGFYMFRTRMPLSIMFVGGDDRVVAVAEMTPCLTDLPDDCPIYYSSAPYTYAVEAAVGTFTDAGVGAGDVVNVERG